MGKEVVYCHVCGERILEGQFESGDAIMVEHKNYCANCKEEALGQEVLEAEQGELLSEEEEQKPARPAIGPRAMRGRAVPRRGGGKTGTRRIPYRVTPGAARPGTRASKSNAPVIIGVIVGVLLLVIVIIIAAASGGAPSQPPPSNEKPTLEPDPAPVTEEDKQKAEQKRKELVAAQALVECQAEWKRNFNRPDEVLKFLESKEPLIGETPSWEEYRKLKVEVMQAIR